MSETEPEPESEPGEDGGDFDAGLIAWLIEQLLDDYGADGLFIELPDEEYDLRISRVVTGPEGENGATG